MKHLLFTILIIINFHSADVFAQTIIDPQNFAEETNPNNSNFQFMSRKSNNWRRASFDNVRKGMLPSVNITPIGYTPAATGNANNRGQFVKTANTDIWYIDGVGAAYRLHDASGAGLPCADSAWVNITLDTLVLLTTRCDTLMVALADNLGNHTATQPLRMQFNPIDTAGGVQSFGDSATVAFAAEGTIKNKVTNFSSGTHSITGVHNTLVLDATAGDVSLNFPDPSTVSGWTYFIRRVDSSNNLAKINTGSGWIVLMPGVSIRLSSDGTNWLTF